MSRNHRWIQSTFKDQFVASSRWYANMISSFLGSRRFGSIVLDFGLNTDFGVGSVPGAGTVPFAFNNALVGTVPSALSLPFHAYVATPPVLILLPLMLLNSVVYITSK